MKTSILTIALLLATALAGCTDGSDGGAEVTTHLGVTTAHASFANPQPESVTGLEFVAQGLNLSGGPAESGSGIWAFGDFVFGSALNNRFWIADVSDPENPEIVYQADDNVRTPYGRDADMIVHVDGSRTLVIATQFDGMHFWDVTDPTKPEFLSVALFDELAESNPSVHNVAVIPGTTYVFNSQSGGAGKTNDLVDATNPDEPINLGAFGTHGCHDITFFGSPSDDKFRAYCAGIQRTEIWNIDEFDPAAEDFGISVIAWVGCPESADQNDPNAPDQDDTRGCAEQSPVTGSPATSGYPSRTLHHLALVNNDASILIIGDEYNGGGDPGACTYYDENTGQSTPAGALWFYDLSDETNPVMLSWISAPTENPGTDPKDPPSNGTLEDKADEIVEDQDPAEAADLAKPYTDNVPGCTAHFGTLVPGEDKIVMAWYIAGILLIDFTDPEEPRIIHQEKPEGANVWDARVHGGYVFTGDINRGLDVLKLI
jgi:hypothetical protein